MTGQWTIDNDGELDWNGEGKITASISGEDWLPNLFEAKAGLITAIRDADRLAKARESVNTELRTWPGQSIQFSVLTWVLDLLTEDGES